MTIVQRFTLTFAFTGLTIFFPNVVKNTQTYIFTVSIMGSVILIIDALKIEKRDD